MTQHGPHQKKGSWQASEEAIKEMVKGPEINIYIFIYNVGGLQIISHVLILMS